MLLNGGSIFLLLGFGCFCFNFIIYFWFFWNKLMFDIEIGILYWMIIFFR